VSDATRPRFVHPDGGAVVLELPMDALHAGSIIAFLDGLGFDPDPTVFEPAVPSLYDALGERE
jgi:hypothetical protein